jgi:Flp pilus assembly protein TadD
LLLLGYANALYGAGEIKPAARAYRDLLAVAPGNVPALNNLAHSLGELGCRSEALALIARASGLGDSAFIAVLEETRREIESQPAGSCQLD